MLLKKISEIPLPVPDDAAFGAARDVQNARVRSAAGALRIESSGRFKRFSDATEYIRIERGAGHIKWKRGEVPFAAGDMFCADAAEEYDFYGEGVFVIVRAQP